MKLRRFFTVGLMLLVVTSFAQYNITKNGIRVNTLNTAVPFLTIGPDARSGGMGDGGVATSPDANAMHYNPAKYAFIEDKMGFAISYTPWLRNLVNDINMAYVSYYTKIDDMQAIAFSLRYFSLGEIQFTDEQGAPLGTINPNEFAIDGTYARKLSDYLSLAVAGRFIYSNLTLGQTIQGVETKPGISVAADVALYWEKDVEWFKVMDAKFAWGMNISNIGQKISYTRSNIEQSFIPTNFRIGPRLTLELDDYNSLAFFGDVNKLLVPTPPIYKSDSSGNPIPIPGTDQYEIAAGRNPDVSVITGMIQSWYDAPGELVKDENGEVVYNEDGTAQVVNGSAFKEELREFYYSIGTEYWYNEILAIRAGYFWEHASKGARQYATLGVGLRYNVFGLDFSYLIPTGGGTQQHPLQNTLRFSLLFNFDNLNKN